MIIGIHHFAIIVSSEASVEFYKKLGFFEIYRRERNYDTVVLLEAYGIQIEMFIDPNHPKSGTPEPIGLRHFALKVDDINKTLKELSRESQKNLDWIGENYCYISDPDGLLIELHE